MVIMNKMSGVGDTAASPISPLTVELTQETNDRLHIKIYDSNNQRWEVPTRYSFINLIISDSIYITWLLFVRLLPEPQVPSKPPTSPQYSLILPNQGEPFSFAVVRYVTTIVPHLECYCINYVVYSLCVLLYCACTLIAIMFYIVCTIVHVSYYVNNYLPYGIVSAVIFDLFTCRKSDNQPIFDTRNAGYCKSAIVKKIPYTDFVIVLLSFLFLQSTLQTSSFP